MTKKGKKQQKEDKQFCNACFRDEEGKPEIIDKRMNNINTFQVHENELCLRGTDEHGEDFTCWFDAYDFLDWIDTENLEYIKEKLIKYIKTK